MEGFDINKIPGMEDFEFVEKLNYITIVNQAMKKNANLQTNFVDGQIYLNQSLDVIGDKDSGIEFSILRMFTTYVVWDQKERKPVKYTYKLDVGGAWSDGSPITKESITWREERDDKTGLIKKRSPYTKTFNLVVCTKDQLGQPNPKYYILALGEKNKDLSEFITDTQKKIMANLEQHKPQNGVYELLWKASLKVAQNDDGVWYEWGSFDLVSKVKVEAPFKAKMDKVLADSASLRPKPFTIDPSKVAQIEAPAGQQALNPGEGFNPTGNFTPQTDSFNQSTKPALDVTMPNVDVETLKSANPPQITELKSEVNTAPAF